MAKPSESTSAKALPAKASGPPRKSQKSKTSKAATAASKKKFQFPPGFRGCRTCGGTDHRRCTKHKCPKHPNYDPPRPRLCRSDSYECPFAYHYDSSDGGGGDWSGMPGHRCQLCGRRSENVGPRRGFDYSDDICGGCADLD
mmetsp:Transcript_15999/g.34803  ORF Transcript_15999/g.34803 Transcript_15999/m.34803 type:complete len:142 (+) Transcript_15999:98-523(+)